MNLFSSQLQKLSLCLLFVGSLLTHNTAYAGGESNAGGNGQKSTQGDVEAVLKNLPKAVGLVLKDLFTESSRGATRTPAISSIVNVMKANSSVQDVINAYDNPSISTVLDFDKLKVVTDGSCRDSGNESGNKSQDASVHIADGQARLCFDKKRLTRFPKSALSDQIIALTIHELAHVAGLGHPEAYVIQSYVLQNGDTCWIEVVGSAHKRFTQRFFIRYPRAGALNFEWPKILIRFETNFDAKHSIYRDYATTSDNDFLFKVDEKSGLLVIPVINFDGSITQGEVKWGATIDHVPGLFLKADPDSVQSNIVIDGKPFRSKDIFIKSSCLPQ